MSDNEREYMGDEIGWVDVHRKDEEPLRSDELKPCPFCGFERPHFMEEGHWIYMACESCGCGGPVSTQMRDPSDNWNTRPLEDALRAELAAKDAEIERLQTWLDEAQSACKGLGQTADNFGARLNAARAEVERLNNLLADAVAVASEGVQELLNAIRCDDVTQQEVVDSFKQYLTGNVETIVCSYCGLLMPRDDTRQMKDHVMKCASNPLVQEVERLRGIIRGAENIQQEWARQSIRVCCDSRPGDEHEPDCPFYQWEGTE